MIRRKKCTIFTDAKETTTVVELKKMIEGITKTLPEDQQLFNYNNEVARVLFNSRSNLTCDLKMKYDTTFTFITLLWKFHHFWTLKVFNFSQLPEKSKR